MERRKEGTRDKRTNTEGTGTGGGQGTEERSGPKRAVCSEAESTRAVGWEKDMKRTESNVK